MNYASFTNKEINNGKQTKVYFAFNFDSFKTQASEILIQQHYKKGRIKKDMLIMDIGANIGLASLYFKDYAKRIWAVEPEREQYKALVRNTQKYKKIKTFNLGILDFDGIANLFGGSPDVVPDSAVLNNKVGNTVEQFNAVTIKKFWEDNKITHLDLLKIDCEGSEYRIFLSEEFKECAKNIDYIIGESHWVDPFFPKMIPLILKDYGFRTRFLQHNNVFTGVDISYTDGTKKEFRVPNKTLFFAHKI